MKQDKVNGANSAYLLSSKFVDFHLISAISPQISELFKSATEGQILSLTKKKHPHKAAFRVEH